MYPLFNKDVLRGIIAGQLNIQQINVVTVHYVLICSHSTVYSFTYTPILPFNEALPK